MEKLEFDDLLIIISALESEKEELELFYEKKIKHGELDGSIISNIEKDGYLPYYNRMEKLIDMFKNEL